MKLRIKRIAPLQAGKMLAGIYALFALILIPFLLVVSMVGSGAHIPLPIAIGMPLLYIVMGFLGGIVGAFFYNLVAGWLGGLDVECEQSG